VWVVLGPFRFETCVIYLYMKTKVEITINPFHLQEVGGWVVFFYTKVIMSRNCMQTYEIIPHKQV